MAFPSRKPKPEGAQVRINSVAAGYMELESAKKDGDCVIVEIKNGVSKELGCCNLFDPQKGCQKFSCGTCEYVR